VGLLARLKQEFFPGRDAFDIENGTNTSGSVSLKRLLIRSKNKDYGICYQGVSPELFQNAIQLVARSLPFIDLGCGKGRALILAHKAGFQRIIGVEFSPTLASAARANVASARVPAEIVTADAAEYRFPDEPCVTFMFHPFNAEVMRQIVPRLCGYVAYVNPECRSELAQLRLVEEGDGFAVFRKD
jgi:SAM-dependent methyltransferase